MRVPSAAGVMHAITSLPCVSSSSLELLDRALPAGAHRAHRRMPAEVRQVEARATGRRAAGSAVASTSYGLSVDVDRSPCTYLQGQRFSRMCRSKSSRKYFSALCSGSAAPGASAQNVLPGRQESRLELRVARDRPAARGPPPWPPGCARPSASPLQHGVHQPQDSCAKKCSRFQTHADRAGLVVEHDHGPGAHAAAGLLHLGEVHRHVEVLARRENRWRRRREARRETEARRACRPRAPRGSRGSVVPIGSSHRPGRFTLPLAP